MDEKELEQAVKKLLVEACSSRRVLEPGIDLLESGLLDSLGLITLLDGLEDMGIEIQPTQVIAAAFAASKGFCSCAGRQRNPLRQPNALGISLAKPSFCFFISQATPRKNFFTKSDKKKAAPERAAFAVRIFFRSNYECRYTPS